LDYNHSNEAKNNIRTKSKGLAIAGDVLPLSVIYIWALACFSTDTTKFYDNDDERYKCFTYLAPIGTGISLVGTLPSHFYAHTPIWKTVTYSTVKLLVGAYFSIGNLFIVNPFPDDNGDSQSSDKKGKLEKSILLWGGIMTAINILEMISQSKAIDEYNQKNTGQLFIGPGVIGRKTPGLILNVSF
jgi:hypothetical protein